MRPAWVPWHNGPEAPRPEGMNIARTGETGTAALRRAVGENPELAAQYGALGQWAEGLRSLPRARAGEGRNTTLLPDGGVRIERGGLLESLLSGGGARYDLPIRVEGYSEWPYGRQIVDTGREATRIEQSALPNVALRGSRRYVGDVRPGQTLFGQGGGRRESSGSGRSRVPLAPRGNLSNEIPRLLAGEVDEIVIPSGRTAQTRPTVLTRDDFLRGVNTPEEAQQRIAEVTALIGEGFPVRVPRNAEQAEAQAQLQGVLNRRTGLPDDEPSHLRGARGALAAEDTAFNADAGGYRAEDPGSVDDWTKSTPELNPYGKAAMVELGPDGNFRIAEYDVAGGYQTVDREPDSTASFMREKQISRGQGVLDAMDAAKTPMVGDAQLERMGFVPLERPEGNLIGFVATETGEGPVPVYRTTTPGNNRVGWPTNRNENEARRGAAAALGTGGPAIVPDQTVTAGLQGLSNQVNRGYTFSIGEDLGGSMPLFDMRDQQSVGNYVDLLRGQPADGFLASQRVYALRPDGTPVQALIPRIVDGQATGHLMPLREGQAGPVALMTGDGEATVALRKRAEAWGERQGLTNTSLEAALSKEAGAGSFMADPSVSPANLADMVIQGVISPSDLQNNPQIRGLFPEGSYARTLLNQEVISRSGGTVAAPFPPMSAWPRQGPAPVQLGLKFPVAPPVYSAPEAPLQQAAAAETLGGQAERQLSLVRAMRAPDGSLTRVRPVEGSFSYAPSYIDAVEEYMASRPRPTVVRNRTNGYMQPELGLSAPTGDSRFGIEPSGQMRIAASVPSAYAPDPVDDLSIYMAQQAHARGLTPQEGAGWTTARPLGDSANPEPFSVFRPAPGAQASASFPEQTELPIRLPRMGEDVRSAMIADGDYPVGRPAGPYFRAPYRGLGDPSSYQVAATAKGAARGFDQGAYRQMAENIGLEVPAVSRVAAGPDGRRRVMGANEFTAAAAEADAMARAQELAMAQLAMRIRHRQQNPPASPRFAGPSGMEQQLLNLSSPLY